MAPDLTSTRRPRAATSVLPTMLPTMGPPSPRHTRGASMAATSPPLGTSEPGITSTAQGPLRHPKPLTPSDLHLVLEKEQEAMVNRLTRELSLLRQQTVSVNSTASSASNLTEPDGLHASPSLGSSTTSHVSRRQRSSSSLSSHTPAAQSAQAASVSGIAPSRDTSHPSRSTEHALPRTIRSREPSVTSRRPSVGSLPSSQYPHGDPLSHYGSPSIYPHRSSVSQTHLGLSSGSSSMARYEEATIHRSELESMKRENEQLRRRVRELENTLKQQKESPVE
ncbi:hypothetical protein N7448_001515 [Penicillium atrosanguineum]|uniref:Uncharacterized protein n=1 Tax=Penicillium atrosanguineum TaxID=1132637 RepID=A0A9W9Q7P1_9EURO|nr:uncharacterized protein N7443_004913 [Penicillium atrosanguineum]KAJ5133457.1 hypothetical protein N7526_004822 [Penicillium atrosanguineum]KAJ5149937.1 hypothetical protein N7448_001515 [Penicillium atrosanguineum]KAJ5305253.1 hypothetical protein N7443_004913 [Penicillium atrosanguineum]KAJ5324717.1 hypothetical protein N7476_003317 [Penicillium atrosanguineum]